MRHLPRTPRERLGVVIGLVTISGEMVGFCLERYRLAFGLGLLATALYILQQWLGDSPGLR